jgi:hypothetical protein
MARPTAKPYRASRAQPITEERQQGRFFPLRRAASERPHLARACRTRTEFERAHTVAFDTFAKPSAEAAICAQRTAGVDVKRPSRIRPTEIAVVESRPLTSALSARPPTPSRLVVAHQPRVADNVGDQDRSKFSGLAHSSGSPALRRPSNSGGRFSSRSIIHLTVSLGLRRRASAKAVFASSILPSSARAAASLR